MASNIPVIVQGNSFSLAIPLQIYYINGDQMYLQDYTPDPTDDVTVQLKGSRRNYTYTPTVDGNICNIDLSGNELAGNYSVVVSIVKASGQRLRSFRTDQFFIVESSDDLTPADIIEGLEENVIYLNSSIFVAGEDGRGIESITKTSTSGLVDTYTITYSDNTTSTFDVTNGAQGEQGVGIATIAKTSTSGKTDTYTITLTNGQTPTFEVTNGLDGVDLGLANIVNDLTTGGATNVLSAEMGKVLNEKIPALEDNTVTYNIEKFVGSTGKVDIVAASDVPTLDSVAFEGKTYRQIFEGSSTFMYDAETSFTDAKLEVYNNLGTGNSITPTRETTVVDSGTYSLYCQSQSGKCSCLRQTSQNTHRLALNKTYYIALRMNATTLPAEIRCGMICESAWIIEQYGVTDGWETKSILYTNNQSAYAKLYFGLFAGVVGDLYLDSIVAVPTELFTNAPTKAQFDELYNTYIDIKKNQATGEQHIKSIIYAPESMENYGFTNAECMTEFMAAMNAKAAKLGMVDSTFSNPYGGDKYGYNWTTVEDMMKMMVYATSYPRVLDYMSQNTQVTFQIYGNNARSEVCPLTANSFLDGVASAYAAKHGSGSTMPYQALSHKGAGWGDLNHKDATSKVRGCVGTAIVGTHHVAYCVFQAASAYQSSGTYYRAIVDLLDICKTYFDGGDISGMDVSNYNYAMAVELPLLNPECYKNNLSLNTIYLKRVLSNGEEVKFNTASASKVLAMMVMLDALGDDLHQVIDVNSYDEDTDGTFWSPNDSEPLYIYAGDKLTLGSSMYGILWWSNGVITLATARKAGGKMLYDKLLKGIN